MTEKKKALKLPEAGGWQDKAAPWLALAGGVLTTIGFLLTLCMRPL